MAAITRKARKRYDAGVADEIPIPDRPLSSLLETAAKYYPDRLAIDFFGRVWTYAEVQENVLRAAELLRLAGVKAGDRVAVILPNCPQHFFSFYAIARLGGVVVEHNPLAPAAELAGQFARHGARYVIAWEKTIEKIAPGGDLHGRTIFSVNLSAGMPRRSQMMLALPIAPARQKREKLRGPVPVGTRSFDKEVARTAPLAANHPYPAVTEVAAILHTGGTNGVPKAVPLTHRNIGANVNQCVFWVYKLHEGAETFYSLLPYFHSFGMTFFLCAAVRLAACQLLLPNFDVEMALAAHRRRPVTFFVGVPPMFDRIARGARERGLDLSTIRWAISGAMELTTEVADLWEEMTDGQIIPGYGLTETSPVVAGSPLVPGCRRDVLGMPFPSTEVRVVDPLDPERDLPAGEPGELLIRGPQVFGGYLDAPEENEQAFTASGWFRTGDIVRHEDGYLVMADRRKELILAGGFNVYPTQVEQAIRSMPQVREVAIVGIPTGASSGEEVTAAVVLEDGATVTLDDVRAWAEKSVAHYALPRQLVTVATLPRSQIGKLLRRKVREELLELRRATIGTEKNHSDKGRPEVPTSSS